LTLTLTLTLTLSLTLTLTLTLTCPCARTTGNPELSEKPERPDWSLHQYIGGKIVQFLNRQLGPNLQNEYSNKWHFCGFFGGFALHHLFIKNIRCASIGAVIIDRNICIALPTYLPKKSPNNYVGLGRNENKSFTWKQQFKIIITLDRHSHCLIPKHCNLPDPPHIALLSTFKSIYICFPVSDTGRTTEPISPHAFNIIVL